MTVSAQVQEVFQAEGQARGGHHAAGAVLANSVSFAVIVGALRLLRVGAWVSTRGLRHLGFFATRTTPWAEVVAVRTVQQPVRWLGLPRTVQGQALILVRSDRPAQDGPVLLTTHGVDFLTRAGSFDRAADTIEAWAAENRRG